MILDSLTSCVWKLLPECIRRRLSGYLLRFREISRISLPRSEVVVFGDSARRLDSHFLNSVSLITTCRNEAGAIGPWLDSICEQTRLPSEVVVCDGGSCDGTPEVIEAWKCEHGDACGFDVIVLRGGDLNIAAGRNRAVRSAKGEILLFSDVGSIPDPEWSSRILSPLQIDSEIDASMGFYKPVCRSGFTKALLHFLLPRTEAVDPATFLPSGRSLAVRREVFEKVGGFPEYLSFAGEDTLFGYYLKANARKLAFVPGATVRWYPPEGVLPLIRMVFNYARGDGEAGKLFWSYYAELLRFVFGVVTEEVLFLLLLASSILFESTILALLGVAVLFHVFFRIYGKFAAYDPLRGAEGIGEKLLRVCALGVFLKSQFMGFLAGVMGRKGVEKRRLSGAKTGLVIALTADGAEQSELWRILDNYFDEGYFVTLVTDADVSTSEQACRVVHPHLECFSVAGFDTARWKKKFADFFLEKGRSILIDSSLGSQRVSELEREISNLCPEASIKRRG